MSTTNIVLILFLWLATVGTLPVGAENCRLSRTDKEKLLSLDFDTFDQSDNQGWRAYGDGGGHPKACYLLAARLCDLYVKCHSDISDHQRAMLNFHAGQDLAFAKSYKKAIAHFKHTFEDDADDWNCYVLCTIAFLRRDREELAAQHDRLARMPSQLNLSVVDDLLHYFDESYEDAYLGDDAK